MIEQQNTAPTSKKAILYERAGGRCEFPGCDITDFDSLTVDHIVSRSRAWANGWVREDGRLEERVYSLENLQLICRPHHDAIERQRKLAISEPETPAKRSDAYRFIRKRKVSA